MKTPVVQAKLDYTVEEISQLEKELLDAVEKFGVSEKDRVIATRIVHTKLQKMRLYVAAQEFLIAQGDIKCE